MNKIVVEKLDKFGKWVVLGQERKLGAHWQILCCCECGLKKFITITHLTSGRSNGCRKCGATKHGERKSVEYIAWNNMKIRCYCKSSKDYDNYGGRGITVCDRWRNSFMNFLFDMGRKPSSEHTLDRKNNDVGYEPENCRWVTLSVQMRNRRAFNRKK